MKNCNCDCDCKCSFTENLKESSAAIWLFAICSFLLGVIIGFCCSPIKNGVTIGSNNIATTNNLTDKRKDNEDLEW